LARAPQGGTADAGYRRKLSQSLNMEFKRRCLLEAGAAAMQAGRLFPVS